MRLYQRNTFANIYTWNGCTYQGATVPPNLFLRKITNIHCNAYKTHKKKQASEAKIYKKGKKKINWNRYKTINYIDSRGSILSILRGYYTALSLTYICFRFLFDIICLLQDICVIKSKENHNIRVLDKKKKKKRKRRVRGYFRHA